MEKLVFKIKISVLWLFYAVAMSTSMMLYLMAPGKMEEIIAGVMEGMPISGGLLTVFALFWLIPLIMAFLTLVLKDSANRWTNFVLGILFTVFDIVDLVGHFIEGWVPIALLLTSLSMIVVPALIAWYAWKWPKQEA